LGRGEVESLANRDVMGQEVTTDCLIHTGGADIYRYDVDHSGAFFHADHKRLDGLQRHQNEQRGTTHQGAHPTSASNSPSHFGCAACLSETIVVPRRRLVEIIVQRRLAEEGLHGFTGEALGATECGLPTWAACACGTTLMGRS